MVANGPEDLLDGGSSPLLESLQGRQGLNTSMVSSLKFLGHQKETADTWRQAHCEMGV